MRTSLNPLMYKDWSFSKLYTEPGTYTLNLSAGTYQYIMRGAGGAGGNNDSSNNRKGGAGGKGELSTGTFVITESEQITVYVGSAGLTYANGGNGGVKGENTDAPQNAGNGGGGGRPSYIKTSTDLVYAEGGGGGGGAGGSDTRRSRYSDGASGGGGGGYYRIAIDGTITSIVGKKGGRGSIYTQNDSHSAAQNGVTGNTTDFPDISSGKGGNGNNASSSWKAGGSAASGGGASGAGGGCGLGNDTASYGGGGGGGAGGSTDAGGGQGGTGYANGNNGSNYHTTPTDTTEENANYGFPGNYGMGGGPNTNGNSGFVFVRLLP